MNQPLTLDELNTAIERSRNGKPSTVFLVWLWNSTPTITRIRLLPTVSFQNYMLCGIEHDWSGYPDVSHTDASLYNTFEPKVGVKTYLYDNYWFAYAHSLRMNEKVNT